MLREQARLLKCSKIHEFFDGSIFIHLVPLRSQTSTGGLKNAKNTVFQGLKTQNDLENMFKVVFGEKILWGTFPDTYLVPYLVPTGFEAKIKCDF